MSEWNGVGSTSSAYDGQKRTPIYLFSSVSFALEAEFFSERIYISSLHM